MSPPLASPEPAPPSQRSAHILPYTRASTAMGSQHHTSTPSRTTARAARHTMPHNWFCKLGASLITVSFCVAAPARRAPARSELSACALITAPSTRWPPALRTPPDAMSPSGPLATCTCLQHGRSMVRMRVCVGDRRGVSLNRRRERGSALPRSCDLVRGDGIVLRFPDLCDGPREA